MLFQFALFGIIRRPRLRLRDSRLLLVVKVLGLGPNVGPSAELAWARLRYRISKHTTQETLMRHCAHCRKLAANAKQLVKNRSRTELQDRAVAAKYMIYLISAIIEELT